MAVSVLQRPQGYILGECFEATVNEAYAGYATVNYSGHGLVDGDYVYISSNVRSYNGFWYVNQEDTNKFKFRRYATADDQDYIKDATIEFCKVELVHNWSCVHLPIAYRLRSNLFPTNEVSEIRTITSFNDDSGYVNININLDINADPFPEPFEFLKVGDTVYQIVEVVSPTSFTINLRYDSTLSLVGQTVQRYYNNYNIQVRVYGGLESTHEWAYKKPMTLLATLSLVPDSNNEVFFSISEILKSQVKINNDLTLDTLPNNIDAFTQFYIQTAENYDDSIGSQYILSSFTSSFTTDSFVGVAANAKLNFKNIHSGNLSEYIMINNNAKFLTLFVSGLTFFGCDEDLCYNEITFINKFDDVNLSLRQELYSNGNLGLTTNKVIGTGMSPGVIRAELSDINCNYDRIDLSVYIPQASVSNVFTDMVQQAGAGVDWTENGTFTTAQAVLTSGQSSDFGGFAHKFYAGVEYTISQVLLRQSAGGTNGETISIRIATDYSSGVFLNQTQVYSYTYNTSSEQFTFTPLVDANYLVFTITRAAGAGSYAYILLGTTVNEVIISETKQAVIDCGCTNQDIRLSWLNNLGGFEYWKFTAEKEYQIDIEETGKTKTNIFPQWPDSYGEFADTIEKQTFRKSRNAMLVRSQYVSEAQLDAIKFIKTSPLVQIVNSRTDRRTVIVDSDSFTVKKDNQDLYEISFRISYTDEISSQTV